MTADAFWEVVGAENKLLCLRSDSARAQIMEQTLGVAQQKLSLKRFKSVVVPLPPLPEQHEIVRRVEGLFALSDQIEARYAKAKAHVEKLTQSILAKAFRGELVPQDPNDEPASVLLKRIRQQRNDNKNNGHAQTKTKTNLQRNRRPTSR